MFADPNRRSLRKASRVVLATSAGFFPAVYVFHDTELAVLTAFAPVVLLGITDFGGSIRQRLQANAVVLVAAFPLVSIGTLVSQNTLAATVTMFLVSLVVSFSAIYSGYFAAGSKAAIMIFVVASGIPASPSTTPARLEGLLFGGVLVLVAAGCLWPQQPHQVFRAKLAASLSATRELLRVDLNGEEVPSESARRQAASVESSMLEAHFVLSRMRCKRAPPPSTGRRCSSSTESGGCAISYCGSLRRPRLTCRMSWAAVEARSWSLYRELSRTARTCFGEESTFRIWLRSKRPGEAFVGSSEQALAKVLAAGSETRPFAVLAERVFLIRELALAVVVAAIHTRIAVGADTASNTQVVPPATPELPVGTSTEPPWVKWLRRAKANLTLGSVHLSNSLRMAVGLALARLVAGTFGLSHPFWVVFATLVVMGTTASATGATSLRALEGTVLGFGLLLASAGLFDGHALAYAVTLPFAIFLAFYTPTVINAVVGQMFFTFFILVLFNVMEPSGWRLGLVRVQDVAIGSAVGVVIGFAMWPRGASGQPKRALAELFDSGRVYVAHVWDGLINGLDPQQGSMELRPAVRSAALRAEDYFSQWLAERRDYGTPPEIWGELLVAAQRLWYSADVMLRMAGRMRGSCRCTELVARLEVGVDAVSAGCGLLGRALRMDEQMDERVGESTI